MKLIYTGSESQIFLNENLIYKFRHVKTYRQPEFDRKIREKRTKKEIKILKKLNDAGITVPQLFLNDKWPSKEFQNIIEGVGNNIDNYKMNIEKTTIIMSYIEGKTLNNSLLEDKCSENDFYLLGQVVAKIHQLGIIHGDITPGNIILLDSKIYIIDFGLSFFSKRMEDRAVDIWMFEKIFKSLYERCEVETCKNLLKHFLDGYLQNIDKKETFLRKLADVRERGRKIGC